MSSASLSAMESPAFAVVAPSRPSAVSMCVTVVDFPFGAVTVSPTPVSYTHLTLPTIYSV